MYARVPKPVPVTVTETDNPLPPSAMNDPRNENEGTPKRRELQKYQAGVFLIILSMVLFALGLFFRQVNFHIMGLFLLGAGIVFQFDKNRPKGQIW